MTQGRRLVGFAVALALLGGLALLLWHGGADRVPEPTEGAGARAAGGAQPGGGGAKGAATKGGARNGGPVSVAAGAPSTGKLVVRGAWGSKPGEFGHKKESEANPEGPMSLVVGKNGDLWVLDQVNARVQRFDASGKPVAEIRIGPDTAQDLAIDGRGRMAVVDRLGSSEVQVYGEDGALVGTVPAVGGPITEGGGVTGIFADDGGVYLEREHTEVVRVAGPDGKADPNRPTDPGRHTRDGQFFLSAAIVDAAGGAVMVREFTLDAVVAWQRTLTFPAPVVHLLLLDSDRVGHVYVAALVAHERAEAPHDLVDARTIVVRLGESDGSGQGSLSLPAQTEPEEVFRELTVGDDGTVYQMIVTKDGVEITRYGWDGS